MHVYPQASVFSHFTAVSEIAPIKRPTIDKTSTYLAVVPRNCLDWLISGVELVCMHKQLGSTWISLWFNPMEVGWLSNTVTLVRSLQWLYIIPCRVAFGQLVGSLNTFRLCYATSSGKYMQIYANDVGVEFTDQFSEVCPEYEFDWALGFNYGILSRQPIEYYSLAW